jgi:microcystin-dependent protein
MAEINFPSSPTNGDTYFNYVYDSSIPAWKPKAPDNISDLSDVVISGDPEDKSMLQYDEENWKAEPGLYFPIGSISVFAGPTAPPGHLLCNGQVLSRSSYLKLFEKIGTVYNSGSESSTEFRLPNINGRVVAGIDKNNSKFNELGKTGGSKTHNLTLNQMPRHTHIQNEHTHTQNSHAHTQDSHNHGVSIGWNPSGWEAANFGLGGFGSFTNTVAVTGGWDIGSTGVAPAIQNNTATNNPTTATNQNAGGSQSHNNIQPYIVMNYVIRFE